MFGLAGQRWKGQFNLDGSPRQKPGPKPKDEGDHNIKIVKGIDREIALGNGHIGGGSLPELIIDTKGGIKDTRRMDSSFRRPDGSVYHINWGRTLIDDVTGVVRKREALSDAKRGNHEVYFEGYGREVDYRKKTKGYKKE